MNHWLATSKENLIPLSVSGEFSDALSEWFFTGHVIDYEDEEIECELCEHPDLSHHYEIENKNNNNKLLVGSSCILKFQEIGILDEKGNFITDQEERRIHLEGALKEKLSQVMLEPLRKLWLKDKKNRVFIAHNAQKLKLGKSVSPAILVMLFKLMKKLDISYKPQLYKVSLRSDEDQYELKSMPQSDREIIANALSAQQIKKYEKLFK